MHKEAFDYVAGHLPLEMLSTTTVVEFGSKDVNGNVNPLLGQAQYIGVDIAPGPNVDLVMDCCDYEGPADIVLCLEVLEHYPNLQGIIDSIFRNLNNKGTAIVTCATTGRDPHSAIDGGPVREGEYYKNITKAAFQKAVKNAGGKIVHIETQNGDLRATLTNV